jgi:hypothetical protein
MMQCCLMLSSFLERAGKLYPKVEVVSRLPDFQSMQSEPKSFGPRVIDILKREHGDPYRNQLLGSEGQAWLDIARAANGGARDLFDGGLSKLRTPTVFIHGVQDPRTEPWELDAVRRELPNTAVHLIARLGGIVLILKLLPSENLIDTWKTHSHDGRISVNLRNRTGQCSVAQTIVEQLAHDSRNLPVLLCC